MVGPNLQKDLLEIVLRFRAHEIVITADIAAMFRQIMVQDQDRDLQQILWRADQAQPIQTYRLNTVTYGTAPVPYIAMRCLRQLAAEEKDFIQAAGVLNEDFYMDDVLTGARTSKEAMELQQQLSQLLVKGQFVLRKWRSNDQRVLQNLVQQKEVDDMLTIDKDGPLKTLGLLWDSKSDTMQYKIEINESVNVTKRLVLSRIAQIFDPLGLLGPVVIRAKCIMQQMWLVKTGWDDPLPDEVKSEWQQYYGSLTSVNAVKISRNINKGNANDSFDIFGFGDASEKAYRACVYAVSQIESGNKQSHLICSKSRVAPLKKISLPRLELNAALLLSRLCDIACRAYGNKVRNVYLWSDSTITLSWIATELNLQKTYVANRVTKIQRLTKGATWHHVSSQENPADLISRGMAVEDWKKSRLWWNGPPWLVNGRWPQQKTIETDTSERKKLAVLIITNTKDNILQKYSSWERFRRIIAYMFRFKVKALGGNGSGSLSVSELQEAEKIILKITQREVFLDELLALQNNQEIPKSSKLAALNPFLDNEGIIRVGGRLSHANVSEDTKHQIVLPAKHHPIDSQRRAHSSAPLWS